MRKFAVLPALLGLLLWVAPGLAQSPVSPATTLSDINTQLPTNNRGAISALTMRNVLGEMLSNFMPLGINKNTSPWQVCAWGTSTLCSGPLGMIDPTTGIFSPSGGGGATPGGSPGQLQFNVGGISLGGFTVGGDATLNTATGVLTINPGVIGSGKLGPNAAVGNIVNGTINAAMLAAGAAVTNLGFTPISAAVEGIANGVATLDASGFVPIGQLPPAIAGGLAFQGNWNANTNSPALTSSVGTVGQYYFVSVSGTTTLNGVSVWTVGDLVLYSSGIWNKIPGSGGSAVTSVAGLGPGDVSGASLIAALALTAPNIGAGNFPNANFGFGATVTPDSLVTINANSGATVAPLTNTILHLAGADGTGPNLEIDAFGAASSVSFRYAGGTRASKIAVSSGVSLGAFGGYAWDGSVYGAAAASAYLTTQNWSPTAHGTAQVFYTVPNNSTTLTEAGRFDPSGGFSVGTTTDNGIGSITANTGFWGDGSHLTGVFPGARVMTTIGGVVMPQSLTQDQRDSTQGYISIFNWIPPAQYAAIIAGTSTYDATANIQSAFSSGLPINMCYPATFNLTNKVTLGAASKVKGCRNATFHMTNSGPLAFNLSATAVVQLNQSVEFSGVTFNFDQPDVAVRASMTAYPPAIGGDGTYTFDAQQVKVDDIVCARGWTCLSTIGNVIGTFTNLRLGALNVAWAMDGTGDFSRYSNIECWWFGFTDNQKIAAAGPGTTCLDIGEGNFSFTNVQAWYSNIFIHAGNPANLFGGGDPIVNISNLQLDTSYVDVTSGRATINSVVGTKDGTVAWGTGRHNGWFFVIGAAPSSLIVSGIDVDGNGEQIAYNAGGGYMSLDNGVLRQAATTGFHVQADGGLTALGSSLILAGKGGTRSQTSVYQTGGGIQMNAAVDRNSATWGAVAIFNTDDARNFIDGAKYAGLNGGAPITAAFAPANGTYENVSFAFSPTLTFGGGATGLTYSSNTGFLTREGANIAATVDVVLTNKGSSTGVAVISGLPVASRTGTTGAGLVAYYTNMAGMSAPLIAYVSGGSTNVILNFAGTTAVTQLSDANFTNTSRIIVTLNYLTAGS